MKQRSKDLKVLLTKNLLYKEYVENKLTLKQIGDKLGLSKTTINNYARKLIPRELKRRVEISKEVLYKEHYEKGNSMTKIAKLYKTTQLNVKRLFKEYNLEIIQWLRVNQRKEKNSSWKGFGEISATHWSKIVRGANKRNIEVQIDITYANSLFLSQNAKCKLTGLPIRLRYKNKENTASLDRIDSSKGYVEGNVQWVHKQINIMKHALKNEEFIKLCTIVANNNTNHFLYYQG